MYHISIGTGCGVFYVWGDERRVRHELNHLPAGWSITIWEYADGDRDHPLRRCNVDEFKD